MRLLDPGDSINRGLRGFWPLDEAGGSVAVDISPNRRNGIRGVVTTKLGLFGRGIITSNTAGSYVSVPNITIPASTPLTVTWAGLYPSATPTDVAFGAGTGVSASPRMMILWPYSNTIYWDYGNDGAGRISTSGTAFAGKWCVWSFVNNGVNRKEIWCNGVRLNSSASTAALGTSFAGLWFGAGPAGNYPNSAASMLAARIHFRALQPKELVRLGRDPWAGTLQPSVRTRLVWPNSGSVDYPVDASALAYNYQSGAVDVARGRMVDATGQSYTYGAGAVDIGRTIGLDVSAQGYTYAAADVVISYQAAATGDTHDGFMRRSRRERAIEAARRRAEEERLTERNALRLSLEAAMGMAAEVVEDAPAEAVEAVQEAVAEAQLLGLSQGPISPAIDPNSLLRVLDKLQAAIESALRAKALADDDADVELLLRAL